MENGDKVVDAVNVEATWKSLALRPRSQLIDVRTRAEWAYVGIPDLSPIGKRAVLVEWQTFPDQSVDPRFAEHLGDELRALGVQVDEDLFFICRSGSRSLAAAKAMAAVGYRACIMLLAASKDRSTTRGIVALLEAGKRQVFPGFRPRMATRLLRNRSMGSLSAHAILVATIFELAFMTQEQNVAAAGGAFKESAAGSSPVQNTHGCHYSCECGPLKDFGCEQLYHRHLHMLCLPVRCDREIECERALSEGLCRHMAPP